MRTLKYLLASALVWPAWSAKLPETERYMEFPNALSGKILKVHKAIDPETGRVKLVSNFPEVASVDDLLNLENSESAIRRREDGALYAGLAEKIRNADYEIKVRVAILLKTRQVAPLDKTRHAIEALISNSQAMLAADPNTNPSVVLARHGLFPILEQRGAAIVIVDAGKSKLLSLMRDPDIAAVWEDVEGGTLAASLSTVSSSGYNPGPVPSGAGSGVKAATFEYGLTSSFLSCLGVNPSSYDTFGYAGMDIQKRHSQATFSVLYASAPGASLYHRDSRTFNSTNDVNYIVNNGIQTLSMSYWKGTSMTSPYRATYSEFLTMDGMAYTYPYPVFANPSGNSGYNYEVNWQSYNAISVGNVRHTDNSTYEMADCTQTKNPPPRYGSCISGEGSNCAGDREMPHIVAPGIPYTGSTFDNGCTEGSGTLTCGTSLSAPVANGMAADVIAADSRMASWPEKVRAAIILTAQNVESGDWATSGDERDGAGTISGSEAVAFASGHTTVSPGNSACVSGMGATSFYSSDFGSNKRFYYQVPNPKPSGKHLRVVLTWDSNPNVSNGTNDLSDLDLVVQNNNGSQSSASWDSNVEIVDVAAASLTAGNTYYIDISPYANRIPSGAYFYYALGWTWVKDHAP